MSVILYSIPFFFLFMGGELVVQARTGRRLFRLNDSLADLSLGILSQLSGIATKFLTVGVYAWVGARWRLWSWPGDAVTSWVAAFVLVDLAYYWSHRLSHEINVLWAGHVVHHSSEEYNLAVALRQSSLHGLFTWIFYTPLAVLGIPWELFVTCYSLNLVYQFWIHTRAVGSLGAWTEWVLNTPSHHRVHHGVNPKYQDRNYAGVFITWDRLFGTFQREEEEPVYGITTPLRSWNPLWANVHVFVDIARSVAAARSVREAVRYVVGPPGWRPDDQGGRVVPPEVTRDGYEAWDPEVPPALAWYGFAQFLVALAAAVLLLFQAPALPAAHLWAGGFYVTLTLAGVGGVFETARWAGPMETWRNAALAGALGVLLVLGAVPPPPAAAGILFCAGSLAWFVPLRRHLVRTELAPIM